MALKKYSKCLIFSNIAPLLVKSIPSKMLVTGEKKFVIKHTFKDFKFLGVDRTYDGDKENHFGVPWQIHIIKDFDNVYIYLECLQPNKNNSWKISTEINGSIGENGENMNLINPNPTYPCRGYLKVYSHSQFSQFLAKGNVTIEFDVKITEMSGIEIPKSRNFEDDNAKEHSDVMLKIGGQKFYVNKSYLSLHSTYFKSLFSGSFVESKKSEIELKDIDPDDFQHFLELLYAETTVKADSVLGILHLADFSDSKTVIRRCQEFLVEKSNLPLKDKYEVAIKYNLEDLKIKCISEMKTVADIRGIVPENSDDFSTKVWKELLTQLLSLVPK